MTKIYEINMKTMKLIKKGLERKRGIIAFFAFFLFLVSDIVWKYQHTSGLGWSPRLSTALSEVVETLFAHGWLEIAVGVALFYLLEREIEKIGDVARNSKSKKRNYKDLMKKIAQSTGEVKILDNDFSRFFEEGVNFELNLREYFKKEGDRQELKILLLHPNTYAAKQRHEDLNSIQYNEITAGDLDKNERFNLFHKMNEGLYKLNLLIEKFKAEGVINEKNKIEVRLFKSTHSIVFVSYGKEMNFNIMPPFSFSDNNPFDIQNTTDLATHFIKHFEELWQNTGKSIILNDYIKVCIQPADNGINECIEAYWAPDSYNHELPIFFTLADTTNSETSPISALNRISLESVANEEGVIKTKYLDVKIFHDGKFQWAKVYRISHGTYHETNTNERTTLKELARRELKRKNTDISADEIYAIEYNYIHKISLRDTNYVYDHLIDQQKEFCYVPHTMYEVSLGTHISETLHCLYEFFKNESSFSDVTTSSALSYHRGKVAKFSCDVKNNLIKVLFENDWGQNPMGWPEDKKETKTASNKLDKLEYYSEDDNSSKNRMLVGVYDFLKSTIEADMFRIIGTCEEGVSESFDVYALLIQTRVSEIEPNVLIDPQLPNNYSRSEKKALYTVLHYAGGKNIAGGIPSIFRENNDGVEETKGEYNLKTALDSIYVKTGGHNNLILKSSKIQFNNQEAWLRDKKRETFNRNNPLAHHVKELHAKHNFGYRNLIVIEFFKKSS